MDYSEDAKFIIGTWMFDRSAQEAVIEIADTLRRDDKHLLQVFFRPVQEGIGLTCIYKFDSKTGPNPGPDEDAWLRTRVNYLCSRFGNQFIGFDVGAPATRLLNSPAAKELMDS